MGSIPAISGTGLRRFRSSDIATGQVIAGHYNRRRRREFLDFMNEIVAAYPEREIHVVLDNLNTHKPKDDRWLRRHPNVHLHFTPTYSSFMNLVESWFRSSPGRPCEAPVSHRRAIAGRHRSVYQSVQPQGGSLRMEKGRSASFGPKPNHSDLCK